MRGARRRVAGARQSAIAPAQARRREAVFRPADRRRADTRRTRSARGPIRWRLAVPGDAQPSAAAERRQRSRRATDGPGGAGGQLPHGEMDPLPAQGARRQAARDPRPRRRQLRGSVEQLRGRHRAAPPGRRAGAGVRGVNASINTRPETWGSVTSARNASVGAMSAGDACCRYSPRAMPFPISSSGTCVS